MQDVRSLPRRRKETNDQPIFLRKTYQMIENGPSEIVSWSENGESFYVKDSVQFAHKVIPKFFKHNNFSSFVRQLNFYGFRKVKSDRLINPEIEDKWFEFRHENFKKDKPQLLGEIKRAMHYGTSVDQKDYDGLKSEVSALKQQVQQMNDVIDYLTNIVSTLVLEQKVKQEEQPESSNIETIVPKKRKINQPSEFDNSKSKISSDLLTDFNIPYIKNEDQESPEEIIQRENDNFNFDDEFNFSDSFDQYFSSNQNDLFDDFNITDTFTNKIIEQEEFDQLQSPQQELQQQQPINLTAAMGVVFNALNLSYIQSNQIYNPRMQPQDSI